MSFKAYQHIKYDRTVTATFKYKTEQGKWTKNNTLKRYNKHLLRNTYEN